MKHRGVYNLILFLLLVCCTSCGYHVGQGCDGLPGRYSSITVPYVIGDRNGTLTSSIIQELVQSGTFDYRTNGGSLTLKVEEIDIAQDNIGFRYDRKKKGKLTKDTIPTEARVTMVCEINVVETCSCRTILGPIRLSASIDYDHDYYSSRDGINIFSLGQLSDLDEAYDAVQVPLNKAMALKIVEYIIQSW